MNPATIQAGTQSKCLAFPFLWKDFGEQRIQNMSKEALDVETSLMVSG
jgi:hypothetical protein